MFSAVDVTLQKDLVTLSDLRKAGHERWDNSDKNNSKRNYNRW